MNRKEQIEQVIYNTYGGHESILQREGFIEGANWADQNPTEQNMSKHLIYHHFKCDQLIHILEAQLAVAVKALLKCDPTIHPTFVCNKIRQEALSKIEKMKGES